GASVVNLFRDGSQGEAFDFTNPMLYTEPPMVGGAFPGTRSMVGPGELRTVAGREVRIERHGGRLVTSQPLGATERLPLISDEPLLMQWPCTLVFSVKADAQQSGRLPVFWQHGGGEEGRVQITLNARLGSGVLTDNDRLQVFIAGITDGKGINEMPLQAETPRGTATVVALVMREGKGASEFWANGRLVDTFTAPPVIYQTTSYLLGHQSISNQQHGCYYGRILTINRALPMHELEQACEW
ncbi:hypothetical protein, partial [Sphingomonas trueperi]|uniref:hypothetical protein n=1 Tax=Sphingomonas trueperi TaxID=53317 RepID=UPI0031D8B918